MDNLILKIAEELKSSGELLKPLSEEEVQKVEKFFNAVLPEVYKSFLLTMGKGAGRYMQGSSAFYNEIYHLKEWAEELLEQNSFKKLPEGVLSFGCTRAINLLSFI